MCTQIFSRLRDRFAFRNVAFFFYISTKLWQTVWEPSICLVTSLFYSLTKKRKHVVVVPSFFTFALSKGVIVFRILMFEHMSPGVTTFNP